MKFNLFKRRPVQQEQPYHFEEFKTVPAGEVTSPRRGSTRAQTTDNVPEHRQPTSPVPKEHHHRPQPTSPTREHHHPQPTSPTREHHRQPTSPTREHRQSTTTTPKKEHISREKPTRVPSTVNVAGPSVSRPPSPTEAYPQGTKALDSNGNPVDQRFVDDAYRKCAFPYDPRIFQFPSPGQRRPYRAPQGKEVEGPTAEEIASWPLRGLDGIDPPPPEADPNYVPPPVRLGSGPHYHIADDGKWWRCPPEQARFEKKMAADKAFALRFGPKIPAKKRLKWADMVDELLDPVFVYPPFPWGTLGQSVVELDETLEALHAMQEDPKLAKDAMSRWPAMGDPAKVVEAEKDDPFPFTLRQPVMTRDGVPAPPTQVLDWKPHESGAILPTVPDQVAPLIFRHANDHDRWGKRRGPKSPFNSFDASDYGGWTYQEMGAVPKMIVPSMFLGSYEEQGAPKVPRPIRSILKKTTKYPDTVYRSVDKLHHKTVVSPPLLQEWRLAEHWEEGPMTPRGSRDQPGKLPMGWDQTVEVKEEYPSASEIVNRPVVLPYDHEAGRYLTPFDDGYHTSKALPPIPSAPSDTGSLRSNPSFDPKNDVSIADALSDAWDPILQLPMQQPSISRAARRSSIARAIRRLPPHDADPDLRPETEGAMADSLSDVWGMVKELSSKEEAMRGSKVVSSSKTTPPVENTTVSSVKGQIVPSIKVVETKTTTPSRQPAFRLSVTEDNTIDAPEPVSFGLSSLPAVSNLALLADPKVRFTFSGEGRKTGMTVEAIRSSTVQVKSDPRVFDVAVAKVEECLRRLHEEPVVPAPPAASPSSSSSSTPSSTPPAVSPSSPSSSSAPSSAPAPAEVQAPVATAVGASFEERKMARLNQAMLNIRRLMKERGITKLPPSFLAGLVPTEEARGLVTEEDLRISMANVFPSSTASGDLASLGKADEGKVEEAVSVPEHPSSVLSPTLSYVSDLGNYALETAAADISSLAAAESVDAAFEEPYEFPASGSLD